MPRMVIRRCLVAVLALFALAGCTSSPDTSGTLPDGAALLKQSAEASKAITSAHFQLVINGAIPGIPIQGAQGDLTKEGNAQGSAKLQEFGHLLEVQFVLVDKKFYIKGLTGGYQQMDSLTNLYDPSAILDPNRGVAKVLTSITQPKTEGRETINEQQTFRVAGKAPKDAVSAIVPNVTQDVDVKVWVREDNKQPVRAWIQLPADKPGSGAPTVEITLSDVNKPVTITKPA
jgi:lipoprotein LprG